jgi:alpha-D-ribose 1-methylphosphonate 5-triphosphate synthase subunit PhnH
MRNQILCAAIAATTLGVGTMACGEGGAANEERLAELRSQRRSLVTQFAAAQNAIRNVQARALEEQGVRAAQDSFQAVLRSVIQRDDPEAVAVLDRAEAVGQDLQLLSTPVLLAPGDEDPRMSPEEQRAVAKELAEVESLLRPVTDRAFQDPDVRARFAILQDSVLAAILRLEPGSQVNLDVMRRLEAQIVELDREMEALSD